MQDEELKAALAHLSNDLTTTLRINPENDELAGWGQFLNAEGHKEQIGPYGTSAALLFRQISLNEAAVDNRIVAQISEFWTGSLHNEKLRLQNVRVAFLILALAKIENHDLNVCKEEAVDALTERQLDDGSWSDWHIDSGRDQGPARPETTAWALLALHRNGGSEQHVEKAQKYLISLVRGGRSVTLSNFAKATLLFTLPENANLKSLLQDAREFISRFDDQNAEAISFFDYLKSAEEGQTSVKRDYLCYPSVLTYSLMIAGLSKHSGFFSALSNSWRRESLSNKLSSILQSEVFFRLPGAKFAATVDQAAIALSYENLVLSRGAFDKTSHFILPIINWFKGSIWTTLVIPIMLVLLAFWILNTPEFATQVSTLTWIQSAGIDKWVTNNDGIIRVGASLVPFIFAYLPGYLIQRLKQTFQS